MKLFMRALSEPLVSSWAFVEFLALAAVFWARILLLMRR
jgi:hypothetical protein